MSNIGKTLVKGHTLRSEGAPHEADGKELSNTFWASTAGRGHGVCSCGAVSPELFSGLQRRQWHREHKGDVAGGVS